MHVLFMVTRGSGDPTGASVPLHLAANGTVEVGDQASVVLAGDATEYLVGDALERAEGVGVPPLRELVAKLRDHEVPVYV
jgi:predicted peroxiredoxin